VQFGVEKLQKYLIFHEVIVTRPTYKLISVIILNTNKQNSAGNENTVNYHEQDSSMEA
jgi:hypothetical protein